MDTRFKDKILIEGEEFSLRKVQRHFESAIYQNKNCSLFLRIGLETRVLKDLNLHKKFTNFGFPVSKVIKQGYFESSFFYVEESLGEKLFGVRFVEDFRKYGKIQEKTFQDFLEIVEKFFRAQFISANLEKNWEKVWVNLSLQELLAEKEILDVGDLVKIKMEKVKTNLMELPFALMQGDFNPYNILENGVVDFETAFYAPVVCDVLALPYYMEHFPFLGEVDVEVAREYKWSETEYEQYFSRLEKVFNEYGFVNIKKYLENAFFLRAIWLTVGMDNWPKQQKFRYELFKRFLD